MTKPHATLALALAFAGGPALADPAQLVGRVLGTTVGEVATALEAEGYEIVDFDTDDRQYEIELLWNGAEYEVEVERATGTVRSAERDD
jgi:hypothetical protein